MEQFVVPGVCAPGLTNTKSLGTLKDLKITYQIPQLIFQIMSHSDLTLLVLLYYLIPFALTEDFIDWPLALS